MAAILAILTAASVVSFAILAAFGARLLRGWYLHEIRRMPVAPASDEAIVTYPLA